MYKQHPAKLREKTVIVISEVSRNNVQIVDTQTAAVQEC